MTIFGVKHGRKRSIFRVFEKKLILENHGWDPLGGIINDEKNHFLTFFRRKNVQQVLKNDKSRVFFLRKILSFASLHHPVCTTWLMSRGSDFLDFFAPRGGNFYAFWASGTRSSAMWEHRYRASDTRNSREKVM